MSETGFQWSRQEDSDAFRTLSSLVKYNKGLFKSAAQSKFVRSGRFHYIWMEGMDITDFERQSNALKLFNIKLDAGQQIIFTDAYMRWVGYGAKSLRPISWAFVIDAAGVVAQYKMKFVGDMRKGTGIDPSKTVVLFERDPATVLPDFEAQERAAAAEKDAQNASKQYVGTVGERREFVATVKMVRQFEGRSFGYYDSGLRTMTMLEDEQGNSLVYWNSVGTKGEKVKFKATVKAHQEYKGVKQTVLSRAKVLESFGGGEDQMVEEVCA